MLRDWRIHCDWMLDAQRRLLGDWVRDASRLAKLGRFTPKDGLR